jgi:multidrug efflux system outer membrane protein
MRRVASALLAAVVAGCTLGPNYQRPQVEVPSSYRFSVPAAQAIADTEWWDGFGDRVLTSLVDEALRNNLDIQVAAARVDQFLGALVVTRSALYPQVAVSPAFPVQGGRQRASHDSSFSKVPRDTGTEFAFYQAALSASWELDLWGKVRRQAESDRATVFASEESRRGVVLSVAAATASGYIALRGLDRRLAISRDTARSRGDALDLFRKRFAGGVVSQLEVSQVQSQYEIALAAVPTLESQVAQQENALSALLGRNPGPIDRGNSIDQLAPIPIPAGLPSELLERRPDIRQAEQQLIAANAQIGAAKALYFPSISLTGLFGSTSTSLSNLFSGPTRTWSYAATLAAPIFNAGQITGQVRQAEALQQQALFTYSRTVQSAFGDVENALVEAQKTAEARDLLRRTVSSLSEYARLARLRYDNGYTSYLEVLDAERSLFEAQLTYTSSQDAALAAQIAIYKAMGGGWIDVADKMTSTGNAAPLPQRAAEQPLF